MLLIVLLSISVNGYENIVNAIYRSVPWRQSDQNFLKNVGRIYQRLNNNNKDGGFWRVTEYQFKQTQNVPQFQTYYKAIANEYRAILDGAEWNSLSYSKLKQDELSGLAMMLFVQRGVELDHRSLGWGPVQCNFFKAYVKLDGSITKSGCAGWLNNNDDEYYQAIHLAGRQIQMEFALGEIESGSIGATIDIQSTTHELLVGFHLSENCNEQRSGATPDAFDYLSKNETKHGNSLVASYSPNWNEADACKRARCDEEWKSNKKTICASVWKLSKRDQLNDDDVAIVTVKFNTVRIDQMDYDIYGDGDYSSETCTCNREGKKELKARVEVKLCDIPELNERCFSQTWSNARLGQTDTENILSINNKDFKFPKSYETTSEDCAIINCGRIDTAALGGIVGVVALAFIFITAGLFFYFRRKKADSSGNHQPGNPTNKHAMSRYEYS